MGIACLEVVVGPKHVRELFMSKTRSRIMLVNTSLGSGRGKHGDMLKHWESRKGSPPLPNAGETTVPNRKELSYRQKSRNNFCRIELVNPFSRVVAIEVKSRGLRKDRLARKSGS